MTIAAIDLYNALLDSVLLMIDRKVVSLGAGEVIRSELRDAMWHSGNPDETRNALRALAFHYGLPTPGFDNDSDLDAILARGDWGDDE